MKTTDFIVEYAGIGNDAEAMGQDHEVQLARQDLYNTAKNAIELHARLKSISEKTGLEGWVSEKITLAADYLATVNNYFAEQDQPDMDMLDSFSFESAEQQYEQMVNESEDHPDEVEDKKLIKKMVKPGALKDGKVDEAFPHDVDHMPGARSKNPMASCQRCHGHRTIWKSPEGQVLAGNNVPGAKQYKCGACKGIGFVKAGVTETSKSKIDRYTKAASDAHGHADFMSRAAGPGQEKFAQDQRKIADKRAAGLRRAADRSNSVTETNDEPFSYEEWKASSVKPRKPRGYRDAEALGQQQKEIDRKKKVNSTPTRVKEESGQQDMTGQTCEKCKKGTYQERSQHDDMEGKVSCSCGNRVDRWKNYQAEGFGDVVKGAKRLVKGKPSKSEVAMKHTLKALGAAHAGDMKTAGKEATRWDKVSNLPNKGVKEDVAEGVADVVKGIKRKVAGKQDPAEVQYQHGFRARQAIDASRKFNNQAAYDNEKKMVDRYNKVHKVVNKEGVEEGVAEGYIQYGEPENKQEFRVTYYDPKYGQTKTSTIKARNQTAALDYCDGKGYDVQSIEPKRVAEGYTVTRGIDRERYQERVGLEGPFSTKIGKVVYYDPREGKYYDPDSDMFIEYDDWRAMNESLDPSGIFAASQYNHAFIVSAEVDGKRKKFRVLHQNAELAKKKFLQHHSMATVTDVKPETVNELDTSTMQAYLTKRRDTATPATAHKAVKQVQGVRNAREKIADKEATARAHKIGRVSENEQVNELNYDRHADSQWNPLAASPIAAAAPFVVINKKTRLPVTKQTFPSARDAIQFIKGNPELTMVRQGSKVSENELTELSNTTLNAYIPKANRSREVATRDMHATGKYDPKVDDKMGRRAEFTMRAKNKVNEAGGAPSTDQILEYLTSGYLMLRENRNMFTEEGFATIDRIYNGLRHDLKDGNYAGFMRSYSEYMSKYPDASVELIDAMFEAAGLESEKGTIEQFLALCSESVTTKPVVESASCGGTSAGAIATGVAGAATGKPGTGKPKKVGNVIKRNKPAFGKGVY